MVPGIDDYKMMNEAVTRYLSHLDDKDVEQPDLILIDGGKGQLSAALKALKKQHSQFRFFLLQKD